MSKNYGEEIVPEGATKNHGEVRDRCRRIVVRERG
jgi:hypothetical protein